MQFDVDGKITHLTQQILEAEFLLYCTVFINVNVQHNLLSSWEICMRSVLIGTCRDGAVNGHHIGRFKK